MTVELGGRGAGTGGGDLVGRQVEGHDEMAGIGKHRGVSAGATAELQYRVTGGSVCDEPQPRVQPVVSVRGQSTRFSIPADICSMCLSGLAGAKRLFRRPVVEALALADVYGTVPEQVIAAALIERS